MKTEGLVLLSVNTRSAKDKEAKPAAGTASS